jgi:hypothetical protein
LKSNSESELDLDVREQCVRYGMRHALLRPQTFEDILSSEPRIITAEMAEWARHGYKLARAGRGAM